MQVEFKDGTVVELIEHIGWGARERIKAAMIGEIGVDAGEANKATISGEALYNGKIKAIEITVVKITNADKKEVAFSHNWLDGLDQEDGDKLYEAVDNIAKTEKK